MLLYLRQGGRCGAIDGEQHHPAHKAGDEAGQELRPERGRERAACRDGLEGGRVQANPPRERDPRPHGEREED